MKALHLASQHIDTMANRPAVAEVISRPSYINCPKEIILGRLQGKYEYGDGRQEQDPNYMIFSQRNCNYPQKSYGLWWLSQFKRWGMVKGAVAYQPTVNQVLRGDIYAEAMKEMGVKTVAADMMPVKLGDATFDPKNPDAYALGFPVKNVS